jgi:hypothetical protein
MAQKVPLVLSILLLLTSFRSRLIRIQWSPDGWRQAPRPTTARPWHPLLEADLDSDGSSEEIILQDGSLTVTGRDGILWNSPETWSVRAAQMADLNRDGRNEVVLLVWRPFEPWPVDAWLPHGGRIAEFHDSEYQSCHLILWGWAGGRYREIWAGSAMAEPLVSFFTADWDGDSFQELLTVETGYDRYPQATALSLWTWNGFGFSLIDRLTMEIGGFRFLVDAESMPSILIDTWIRTPDPRR